jgi:plasmid stability protein
MAGYKVRDRLRLRAARAGTSMEAEVRAILIRASAD